jgi:hypothetical protein
MIQTRLIQARALEPSPDLCCLPSPHRIPKSVAGMAFNFSKIEISHRPLQRKISHKPVAQLQSTRSSAVHV